MLLYTETKLEVTEHGNLMETKTTYFLIFWLRRRMIMIDQRINYKLITY